MRLFSTAAVILRRLFSAPVQNNEKVACLIVCARDVTAGRNSVKRLADGGRDRSVLQLAASRRGPHHAKNRGKKRALGKRRFFEIFSYAKNSIFVCSCLFLRLAKNRPKNSPKRLLEGTQ